MSSAEVTVRAQAGSPGDAEDGAYRRRFDNRAESLVVVDAVLSIAASRAWPIHQLDVKNAFLHGHLEETVYCQQPSGFIDSANPDYVCLLQKSLYGLKQAPRAWNQRFASYICRLGFTATKSDASLFVYKDGDSVAYLLLYVDRCTRRSAGSTPGEPA